MFIKGDYKKDIMEGKRKVWFNVKCNDEDYVLTESVCGENNGKFGCQPQMNFICLMNKSFRVKMID